jgi:hypothetical protein
MPTLASNIWLKLLLGSRGSLSLWITDDQLPLAAAFSFAPAAILIALEAGIWIG